MHRSGAHRDKLVMEHDILTICREETIKSAVGRKANLAHREITYWLDAFVEAGYMVKGGGERVSYKNTDKGERRRRELEIVCKNTHVIDLMRARRDIAQS